MRKHGMTPTWSKKYKTKLPTTTGGVPTSESEEDKGDELDKQDDRSDSGDLDVDDIVEFD
jgi:hypothetical protein